MKDTKKLCNREKSIKLCKWEIEQMDLKKIKTLNTVKEETSGTFQKRKRTKG